MFIYFILFYLLHQWNGWGRVNVYLSISFYFLLFYLFIFAHDTNTQLSAYQKEQQVSSRNILILVILLINKYTQFNLVWHKVNRYGTLWILLPKKIPRRGVTVKGSLEKAGSVSLLANALSKVMNSFVLLAMSK